MWTLHEKNTSGDDDKSQPQSQSPFMPNTTSYNLYINALAKSKSKSSHDNKQAAVQAELVLRKMLELGKVYNGCRPNVVSYTSVMDAYAQQPANDPTAADSAERILLELVTSISTGTLPNIPSPTSTNQVTFVTADTVLNAWAQQGTARGAARAQQILERLEEAAIQSSRGRSSGNSIRPTAFSYATVIHGWAQVGGTQGAAKAQEVLDRLSQ